MLTRQAKKRKRVASGISLSENPVRIFTREVQQDKESASDIAAHWDRKKRKGPVPRGKRFFFKMGNQWCIFYNGPCRVFCSENDCCEIRYRYAFELLGVCLSWAQSSILCFNSPNGPYPVLMVGLCA